MNSREKIYYLLDAVESGEYDMQDFADEFTQVFDLQTDYSELSEKEYRYLGQLSTMASRFSSQPEDVKLDNVYFSQQQILEEISFVRSRLVK